MELYYTIRIQLNEKAWLSLYLFSKMKLSLHVSENVSLIFVVPRRAMFLIIFHDVDNKTKTGCGRCFLARRSFGFYTTGQLATLFHLPFFLANQKVTFWYFARFCVTFCNTLPFVLMKIMSIFQCLYKLKLILVFYIFIYCQRREINVKY